jgi:hypothetical protein
MDNKLILYTQRPVFFVKIFVILNMRYVIEKAIKKREVRYSWFRVYEGSAPEYLLAARHHYKNFFEIPILFYLLCIILYVIDDVRDLDLWIAWLFVVFKFIHSYIRLTSNYVPNRAYAFYICVLLLLGGWIYLAIRIL